MRVLLVLLSFVGQTLSQYNSQTYPDPRLDPLSCRVAFPGPVCDPSSILSDEERAKIVQRIQQLVQVTAPIRNTSPSCALKPNANLEVFVAVIDKIGSVPHAAVDIEKFANNLKRRYQNFQDIGMCDTSVLIVNSRQDRQVFTVAGRDARISKDILKKAFERNVGHFKEGHYGMGLEGMVEVIVAAYGNSHIVQTPTPDNFLPGATPSLGGIASSIDHTHNSVSQRASGLPQVSTSGEKRPFNEEETVEVEEKDRVWVDIMQLAISRCGDINEQLLPSIRAVVEEAMALSLQLISDTRYNSIEEEVDTHKDVLGIREQAWASAGQSFLMPMFNKYSGVIHAGATKACPATKPKKFLTRTRH